MSDTSNYIKYTCGCSASIGCPNVCPIHGTQVEECQCDSCKQGEIEAANGIFAQLPEVED